MRNQFSTTNGLAAAVALLVASGAFAAAEASCARTTATMLSTGVPATGADGMSSPNLSPPIQNYNEFAKYMREKRGDSPAALRAKWGRYAAMVKNGDLRDAKVRKAFLAAPREEFSRTSSADRSYAHNFLAIGCGVTISGPHIVGRMTSELDVQPGEKVLEVGTGSGYQAAMLSYLTDKVYTIEIIPPLSKATNALYNALAQKKYPEFNNIRRKTADGYYGWEEHAPFDKIIVTAGIDHIPPPLLKQLKVGGMMIIPVGPPGAQALLKVTKQQSEAGRVRIARHDIYANDPSRAGGRRKTKVSFVPFTKYDEKGRTRSRWAD